MHKYARKRLLLWGGRLAILLALTVTAGVGCASGKTVSLNPDAVVSDEVRQAELRAIAREGFETSIRRSDSDGVTASFLGCD